MKTLSQLKLCFLAGTLEHGGAERQLFYILQALCQAGAKPRVLCLAHGEFWEERIAALGIPVSWVGKRASRLRRLVRILNEVRKHRPAVLQSQHFYVNAYVGLTARFLRVPGIGALRSNGRVEIRESGQFGGWLNLYCPALIAANSQNAMRYALARGYPADGLFYLPNVVDTERFQPRENLTPKPFTLIAVGRLSQEKRLDRFLAILARLRNVHRLEVRGLIFGKGRQEANVRPELEQLARQLGLLPTHVQFRGAVADAHAVYREAAVCVLNSDHEGTPNVLLEAMASGLPVVASRVGGVPEIVRHGRTGCLLEPDDVEGFAATLAALGRNPELCAELGRNARAFVEENHSLHRLPASLERLYQLALPPGRSAASSAPQNAAIQSETYSPPGV